MEVSDLSSDTKLKEDMSKLFRSVQAKESRLTDTNEQILTVILKKIYLVSGGYRNAFIYYFPFSDLLSSSEEQQQRLGEFVEDLMGQNLVTSKAWGTFSITHQGIKKL